MSPETPAMRVERRAFHDALKELTRVADPRSHLPILATVRLEAKENMLFLAATNVDVFLAYEIPAQGSLKTFCLPAKTLEQLVKPETKKETGFVEIENLPDNQVAVRVDGVSTKLTGFEPADFPAEPEDTGKNPWILAAMLPSEPFQEAISFVLPAVSQDVTRQALNGVLLSDDRAVATDGSRLHLARLPALVPSPLLVPGDAMEVLQRILRTANQVVIARTPEHVRFRVGPWQLDARLIQENFPEVDHVIPDKKYQPTRLMVDVAALSKALTRLGRLSKRPLIKFRVNGAITLSTWDADVGEAEVVVPALQSTHKGEDLLTGFNAVYLQDALRGTAKTVELGFAGSIDPLRIDLPEDRLAVVMPIRV